METKKLSFFKRVKLAITNFESYSDFAVEKFSIAVKYVAKIAVIFSIIISIVFAYKFFTIMNNEQEVQIMKNQLLETSGLDVDIIQETIQYIKDNNNISFYASIGFSFFIYFFGIYFFYIFFDALLVSILGFFTSRLAKIKLKYKPIYIMSMYALTLPIILNCIYIVANTLTGFTIEYFQIVYNVIAYIYIVTAILMIKTDFIEQQRELIKIVQEQRKVKLEQKQDDKEKKKEDKEDDENKDLNEEPNSESGA